ncbi:fibronectin type III domain-containing protein [bacterium]|nr:fibronectin type III domain-containing protein [bacterium]
MLKHYRTLFVPAFIIILIMMSGCASDSPTSPGDNDPVVDPEGMKDNNEEVMSMEDALPQTIVALDAPSCLIADLSEYIPDVAETNGKVILSWIDNSHNQADFLIERKVDDGLWVLYAQIEAGATSYSDLNLETGKTFSYRVQAVSMTICSDYSNEASVFTGISTFNPKTTI